jgi:amidohydrolase
MNDFLMEALNQIEYTRALRRDFHRHPELGFKEIRTAGIVARELNKLGLEVTTGIAKTGVVGLLESGKPGPVVMLRFDMDALPIREETQAEYASENPGVMHACGHDGHTAVGLTVARLLQAKADQLAGTLKFVFQPAEEGLNGAECMVKDGVLQNPKPDYVLGMHLWNERPLGWVGVAGGPVMAGAEIFKVVIRGKGGHGAIPNLAIDPVLAAAHVVIALQSIVARNVSPLNSAVVSVTTIHGGEAFNVIPPAVELQGTIRTFDQVVRLRVLERLHQIIRDIAEGMECQAEIEVKPITPAVVNDAHVAAVVRQAAEDLWAGEAIETSYRTMGSEDMAFFMREIPGCFFFIGSANVEKGLNAPHHHPRFDIDEEALPRAAALMAGAAARLLTR